MAAVAAPAPVARHSIRRLLSPRFLRRGLLVSSSTALHEKGGKREGEGGRGRQGEAGGLTISNTSVWNIPADSIILDYSQKQQQHQQEQQHPRRNHGNGPNHFHSNRHGYLLHQHSTRSCSWPSTWPGPPYRLPTHMVHPSHTDTHTDTHTKKKHTHTHTATPGRARIQCGIHRWKCNGAQSGTVEASNAFGIQFMFRFPFLSG